MTRTDVLTMLADKKLSVEDATKLLAQMEPPARTADSVSILNGTGKTRFQNGAQADLTVAQYLTVKKQQDKADALLAKELKAAGYKVVEKKQESKRDQESYSAFYCGKVLLGYKKQQADAVIEFFKAAK